MTLNTEKQRENTTMSIFENKFNIPTVKPAQINQLINELESHWRGLYPSLNTTIRTDDFLTEISMFFSDDPMANIIIVYDEVSRELVHYYFHLQINQFSPASSKKHNLDSDKTNLPVFFETELKVARIDDSKNMIYIFFVDGNLMGEYWYRSLDDAREFFAEEIDTNTLEFQLY